jgi:putative transcription factor
MPCEMCGKEVPARFGEDAAPPVPKDEPVASGPAAVSAPPPRTFVHHGRKKDVLSRSEMELADDYNRRIIQGRRKKDLTQEELAKRINEKKSVISRLETGEMRPSDRLVKKLEKELDVRLMERVEYQVETTKKRAASGGVTLGDLIRMEK